MKNRVSDMPPTMRPEATGRRLVALRESLGLSQIEFCRAVGVDPSAYNKMERGIRLLPDRVAYLIAQRFDVTMDFLYRERFEAVPEPLRGEIFKRLAAS